MRIPSTLILVMLLAACGPASSADLKRPVFSTGNGDGLCHFVVSVDADRAVWTGSNCEGRTSGLHRGQTISAESLERLKTAFAALPSPPPTCPTGQQETTKGQNFTLAHDTADASVVWPACVSGDEPVEPYKAAIDLLNSFAP